MIIRLYPITFLSQEKNADNQAAQTFFLSP